MKKKILSLVVALFAMVAAYNVYISQNNVVLSSLALNNVEALADNNEWGSEWCYYDPFTTMCYPYVYGVACYCDM